jgi:hypothetical protein
MNNYHPNFADLRKLSALKIIQRKFDYLRRCYWDDQEQRNRVCEQLENWRNLYRQIYLALPIAARIHYAEYIAALI